MSLNWNIEGAPRRKVLKVEKVWHEGYVAELACGHSRYSSLYPTGHEYRCAYCKREADKRLAVLAGLAQLIEGG